MKPPGYTGTGGKGGARPDARAQAADLVNAPYVRAQAARAVSAP
ncbi:MAG: hypothetical protein ACLTW9_11675 [Enterocloster sp.]